MEKLTESQKKVVAEEEKAEKVFQKEKETSHPLTPDQLHRCSQVLQSDSGSKLDEVKKILEEK